MFSRDSNYRSEEVVSLVSLVLLSEKLSCPQFYKDLTILFFKLNKLRLILCMALKLHQCVKRTTRQRILGANFYICRIYRGKTDMGIFFLLFWIGISFVVPKLCHSINSEERMWPINVIVCNILHEYWNMSQ